MQLKRLLLTPLILAKHGSLRPQTVRLADSTHLIHLNPADNRAYKKLVMDSARGRISTPMRFWRDHVRALVPALCLDVGANYGECFLFGDYPRSQCVAVEANPILQPYLQRSREEHPDHDRIHVEASLIGDLDGVETALYYSPEWTGGGSAIQASEGLQEAKVMSRTLDAIVAEYPEWHDSPVVIKMDIEGYEGRALAGFSDLFRRSKVVGIMEFDTYMLGQAGTEAETVFNRLKEHFSVFLTFSKQRQLLPVGSWVELMKHAKGDHLHCDLAFCTQPALIVPNWQIL